MLPHLDLFPSDEGLLAETLAISLHISAIIIFIPVQNPLLCMILLSQHAEFQETLHGQNILHTVPEGRTVTFSQLLFAGLQNCVYNFL